MKEEKTQVKSLYQRIHSENCNVLITLQSNQSAEKLPGKDIMSLKNSVRQTLPTHHSKYTGKVGTLDMVHATE